jgi:hypothetical protein
MSQDNTEETKVETTTPPASEETKSQEEKASDADETAKDSASESESNEKPEIDYKAELEAQLAQKNKQLSQAEHTIEQLKKAKKEDAPPATEETSQEFITAEELTRQIEARNKAELAEMESRIKREMSEATIEEELSRVSSNLDEQALIKFHYENSIKQSGFTRSAIQQDLARARLLANEKKLTIENEELKEALKAKNSTGNASQGSNQDKTVPEDEPNLTPQERSLMKRHADRAGLTLKEYLRRNKSRLTNE